MMDVYLDRLHSHAVCMGIGERLATALAQPPEELPPHLAVLLQQQLANVEAGSPSARIHRS
jgi:hypothetical protein